ncbi:MAG: hypothetical protein JO194_02510 [Candidatus Eremiobacteraeota bacterium]|nr:hypothetical protein [Candidatus Eremiobacteraeota bacterium]
MEELADRLGGLILTGLPGATVTDEAAHFIAGTAGAVLFRHNIATVEQVRALVSALQNARSPARAPLLIAVDEEGGPVTRMDALGSWAPAAMALGAAGDPSITREVYARIGNDARELGISLDFAPVADVNTDPSNSVIGLRSFGADADAVAAHVSAAIEGLHDAGIAATAKHFPGHGGAREDTHVSTVALDQTQRHIRDVDLAPFRAAIATGVDCVMAGHLQVPALDEESVPATRSRTLLKSVLRDELGFQGVICSDDMQMKGVGAGVTLEEAAVLSVRAGIDVLVYAEMDAARRALAALRAALADGRLQSEDVEASLTRVERVRARTTQPRTSVTPRDGASLARAVASRAVALVRARGGVPPLGLQPGARVLIINFTEGGPSKASGARVESALGRALAAAGLHATEQLRDLDPAGHEYKQLLLAAQTADAFVAITRRASAHPLQARAVADLALFGKPVVAVAALEPYDATAIPGEMAVIATFGDSDASLYAAAEVLLGSAAAPGRVPVPLAQHADEARA